MGKYLQALKDIETWFRRQKRVLPWRDQPTLYGVWVSEIMLQQTQVATVIPFYERFMARFPTVESLARSSVEEVLQYWAGLGYYSRARNLHRAAQSIVGSSPFPVFPRTREEWLQLPGVGNYTAGAILSIALDQPEPILDGNVERVLSRLRRVTRQKGDGNFKKRLWRLSRAFVIRGAQNKIRPSVINQALMEIGATVCTPRNPQCQACPLQGVCRAYPAREIHLFPPRKKRKEWVQIAEKMHCVIDPQGKILLRRRKKGEWREGLWDFLEKNPNQDQNELVGRVETQHIVTRHKIKRETSVWIPHPQSFWTAADSGFYASEETPSDFRWVSACKPEVPVGSALRRTLDRIFEIFPEVSRQNSKLGSELIR